MRTQFLTSARILVLRNVCILTGILFGIQICSCDFTQSTYYKHENTSLTAVYDKTRTVTDIVCCIKCHSDSSCNSVSYNSGTKECQLSTIKVTEAESAKEDSGEWATFSVTKPRCKNFLVSGPNGVNDSQLTESNYACTVYHCTPSDGYSAKYARLHNGGVATGGWHSESVHANEYVQVDFLNLRTISAIALQGHEVISYVTSFKVATSKDCGHFTTVTDDNGHDMLFEGNSFKEQVVIRDLPRIVRARCVRILPMTWAKYQALRFDVMGC